MRQLPPKALQLAQFFGTFRHDKKQCILRLSKRCYTELNGFIRSGSDTSKEDVHTENRSGKHIFQISMANRNYRAAAVYRSTFRMGTTAHRSYLDSRTSACGVFVSSCVDLMSGSCEWKWEPMQAFISLWGFEGANDMLKHGFFHVKYCGDGRILFKPSKNRGL